MSLQEQYEALLRRGMPEHPSVHVDPDDGVMYLWGKWGREIESDARDLVTMHAMRHFEPVFGVDYLANMAHLYHGDDLLEAMMVATAHMEPKTT